MTSSRVYRSTQAMLLLSAMSAATARAQLPAAQPAAETSPTPRADVRADDLPCGVRAYVLEDRALPLIALQLTLRGGAALDPPTRPGLCNLVRVMLDARGEAAARLHAAGALCDSRTGLDTTAFRLVVPREQFSAGLAQLAERLRPLDPTPADLARGVELVQSEARRQADELDALLLTRLFAGNPYGHDPRGDVDRLRDVPLDLVREFSEQWLGPGRAALVVVGDAPGDALEQVRAALAVVKRRESPRLAEPSEPEPHSQASTSTPLVGRAELIVAWRVPSFGSGDISACEILLQRVFNGVDGLLGSGLDALHGAWRIAPGKRSSLLVLSVCDAAKGPPGTWNAAEVESRVLQALQAARDAPAGDVAHVRTRQLAAAACYRRTEALRDRVRVLSDYEMVGGDLLLAAFEQERLPFVPVGEVQAAAELLLTAPRVFATHGPAADDSPGGTSGRRDGPLREPLPLERLLALAGEAPALTLMHWPPARMRRDSDGGVRALVLTLPGAERTVSIVRTPRGPATGVSGFADVATYRGWDWSAGHDSLRVSAPAADFAAALEWQARAGGGGGTAWTLVGAQSADQLVAALAAAMQDARPFASGAAQPVQSPADPPESGVVLRWTAALPAIDAGALAILAGGIPLSGVDGDVGFAWRHQSPRALVMLCPSQRKSHVASRVRARLAAVADGRVSDGQLEAVRKIAAHAWRVSLDSATSVAEWLAEAGESVAGERASGPAHLREAARLAEAVE